MEERYSPNDYRYTCDIEVNQMAKLNNPSHERSGYDRIIFQSSTIQSLSIEIVGKDSLGHLRDLPIFVPDHFGLIAVFRLTH